MKSQLGSTLALGAADGILCRLAFGFPWVVIQREDGEQASGSYSLIKVPLANSCQPISVPIDLR